MPNENLHQPQKNALSSNRSFGLVFTAVFLIVSLQPLLHRQPLRIWALGLSSAFLLIALVKPASLSLLNHWWTRFGLLLHSVISPIALGVLFFGVVMPIGIIMRLTGHDPLLLKFDRKAESYWIRRKTGQASNSMINQF